MASDGKKVDTYGVRRRFRGKMVHPGGGPRAHHPDSRKAPIYFECSGHKVEVPAGRSRYVAAGGCPA